MGNHARLPTSPRAGYLGVPLKQVSQATAILVLVGAGMAGAADVTTVAGAANGLADGPAVSARFDGPSGVAVDLQGSIYVADSGNHRIRKIDLTPNGLVVQTLAGTTRGTRDGLADEAQFDYPTGVAVDRNGTVYVAEYYGHRIRKITINGTRSVVTTVAGDGSGFVDGPGEVARFRNPAGIEIDAAGNLLVADRNNNRIRKISFEADSVMVTTIAGSGDAGFEDGPSLSARFHDPMGVAVDQQGDIYVADRNNHRVRKISTRTYGAIVSTIAGSNAGFADGPGAVAKLDSPYGIAVGEDGTVFVADSMNNRIRTVSFGADGPTVTTLAGTGKPGSVEKLN